MWKRALARILLAAIILLLALTACGLAPGATPTVTGHTATADAVVATNNDVAATTQATTPQAVMPQAVMPQATEPEVPTLPIPTDTSPPLLPSPTALPAPTATALPLDLSIAAENVYLYPVPSIFAGDRVTFQVLAHVPPDVVSDDVTVHILVDNREVVNGALGSRNLAGEAVGLFEWAWDTTDQVGDHEIRIILDHDDVIHTGDENPANNQATFVTTVYDPATLSASEVNATWVTAENTCCFVHVVSGTAAYRDLPHLLVAVDGAVQQAAEKLGEQPQRKFDVYLIDRIIGQGGYAGSAMVISYLDRQYTSNGLHQVLTHEATHLLDRQFAPQRITFLAEGLAVWASEGHYKSEELNQRTAALVAVGRYIPLAQLVDNFYPVQHEIGYLQAAGFATYLIDTYGWPTFRDFYGDVTQDDAPTLAEAVDLNLQIYYNKTLPEIEADWLNYLATLPEDSTVVVDLETTIRYYNVMRHYQTIYDPTAYFLSAWLPYPHEVKEQGNPADLTRHPQSEINVTLEVMLQAANIALESGDYNRANVLLDSVSRVLDNDGAFIDPLAISYLDVVRLATNLGYDVQQVILTGDQAQVMARRSTMASLTQLDLMLRGQGWVLLN